MNKLKTVYIVEEMQDLTACDCFNENDESAPTSRLIERHEFDTSAEAEAFFEQRKTSLKFAGLAGQYVCQPYADEIFPDVYLEDTHETVTTCKKCRGRFVRDNDAYETCHTCQAKEAAMSREDGDYD